MFLNHISFHYDYVANVDNARGANLQHLSQHRAQHYEHQSVPQSLHLMHINNRLNYVKPISSLSNNQLGYIQDPMVGEWLVWNFDFLFTVVNAHCLGKQYMHHI